MAQRIPKWEDELWSYVSNGDGVHCRLYEHCQGKKESGWCLEDHVTKVRQMLEHRQVNDVRYGLVIPQGERFYRPCQLVERVALKYLRQGKVSAPPVPVELISLCAAGCTVEVRSVPLKAYHGAIWSCEKEWIIQVRRGDTEVMKRHTLFHEAFHILAHRQGNPVFRKRGLERGDFNEGLADYFAMCIMMPREWVEQEWAQVKDAARMARIFAVPRTAMWLRLRQLGLV